MKKLMIMTVALCSVGALYAAAANWAAAATGLLDGTGTTTRYSGIAYIFDSGVTSQESLFDSIVGGATLSSETTGYVASGTVANGSLSATTTTFSYGQQSASETSLNTYSFYLVLLKDENIYFSNIKTADANATATAASIGFGNQASGSRAAPTADGFQGAGKWSSVPEPTSAMLLMLGLCGLALKRKNA